MQKFNSFVARAATGGLVSVACGESFGALKDVARKAQHAGLAHVAGEAVPIIGGAVFASTPFVQPFVFRCLTPDQRKAAEAKAKADAKAAKEKADAEAKAAKAKTDAEAKKG